MVREDFPERMTLEQKSQASEGNRYAGSVKSLPGRGSVATEERTGGKHKR